jgi:hypothetical protein
MLFGKWPNCSMGDVHDRRGLKQGNQGANYLRFKPRNLGSNLQSLDKTATNKSPSRAWGVREK